MVGVFAFFVQLPSKPVRAAILPYHAGLGILLYLTAIFTVRRVPVSSAIPRKSGTSATSADETGADWHSGEGGADQRMHQPGGELRSRAPAGGEKKSSAPDPTASA
jgi:hypothetical protein